LGINKFSNIESYSIKKMNLGEKVIKGSFWSALSNIVSQILSFIITIILVRILVPEDFGIVAISSVIVGIVNLFQDLGLGSALIQRHDINEEYLSTSFIASFVAGIFLSIIVILTSPLLAIFFKKEILKYVISVTALGFIISPMVTINNSILIKKMDFFNIGILNFCNQFLYGFLTVGLALLGYGVWSIVVGKLTSQTIMIPVYWRISGWRPRVLFKKECFKDLFGFSSNLLGFNIVNYFSRNLDNIIVGKYLGTQILGYYSIAYNLMLKPLQLISWSVGRVLLPAFSSIQSEIQRVQDAYIRVIRSISLITFPMMAGLFVISREVILIFYGTKWEPVILPLKLLCIVGALQSVGTVGGSVVVSLGRTDLLLKLGIFNTTATLMAFMIGIKFGIIGLIVGYIIVSFPILFICQFYIHSLIFLKMKRFLNTLMPATISSLIMVIGLIYFRQIGNYFGVNYYIMFVLNIIIGVIIYFCFIKIFFDIPEIDEGYQKSRQKLKHFLQDSNKKKEKYI
jgi:O-antigen/teichoic acid export membrane protein